MSIKEQKKFEIAMEEKNWDVAKKLIKLPEVNPSVYNSYFLIEACYNGQIEIIKLLLNDSRIDPSIHDNLCILNAYDFGRFDIVELLWNDERVKESLIDYSPDLGDFLQKIDLKNNVKKF